MELESLNIKPLVCRGPLDILDFSREGIALKLDSPCIPGGETVRLKVITDLENNIAAKDFKQELIDPCNGIFEVVYSIQKADYFRMGFRAARPNRPAQ